MTVPNFEIPTEIRSFAEKSVEQARSATNSLFGSVVKSAEHVQSSSKTANEALQAVIAKGLDHAQENASSTFDFAHKLVRSRDLREAFSLQGEFLRSRIATIQGQVKDLGAVAQSAAKLG